MKKKSIFERLQETRSQVFEHWKGLEDKLIEAVGKTGDEKLMDLFLDWQTTRTRLNSLGIELMKNVPKWESMELEPTMKDVPFLTRKETKFGYSYDLWEDTDWFAELSDKERLSWQHWHKLEQKPAKKISAGK